VLIKREFSQQILEKSFKYQISRKSVQGSRVVTCCWTDGRTDGQTRRLSELLFAILQKLLKIY